MMMRGVQNENKNIVNCAGVLRVAPAEVSSALVSQGFLGVRPQAFFTAAESSPVGENSAISGPPGV
jgi:hypothetical protein